MVIMDMGMARKRSYLSSLLLCALSPIVSAGEWKFDPSISVDETYTNNVELSSSNKLESYVNQTTAALNTTFSSKKFKFLLEGTTTYASYSHDHDLDDIYRTLSANARMELWTSGPAITAAASIQNENRNAANNNLANLVSGDTVETQSYQTGIEYNVINSTFLVGAVINYIISQSEDNIGENEGVTAQFSTQNGSSNRFIFWQANGNYFNKENNSLSSESYSYELKLGFITHYSITPFVRVYDEDSTGSVANNQNNTMRSWGPGVNWQLSSHLQLDLSYNYVEDKKSDDYISANVSWQPSSRTSLQAGLSQRFFGNSYNLSFQHTNRRLTNSISYNETIQAFDRNNYQQVLLGQYWCPVNSALADSSSNCYATDNSIIDFNNYQLVAITEQILLESNEFSLNKIFSLSTSLKLARTSFNLTASNRERESLTSNIKDNTFSASFDISRKISGRSDLTLGYSFLHSEKDKNQIQSSGQEDFYRTVSTTYSRRLGGYLSASFSIQYLNRDSNRIGLTYEETRAFINIKKDF